MTDIIGRARAKERGYYPDDGVHFRLIEENEDFDLVEGRTEGRWFEVLELDGAKKTPTVKEPVPKAGQGRQAKPKPAAQTPTPDTPEAGAEDGIV